MVWSNTERKEYFFCFSVFLFLIFSFLLQEIDKVGVQWPLLPNGVWYVKRVLPTFHSFFITPQVMCFLFNEKCFVVLSRSGFLRDLEVFWLAELFMTCACEKWSHLLLIFLFFLGWERKEAVDLRVTGIAYCACRCW